MRVDGSAVISDMGEIIGFAQEALDEINDDIPLPESTIKWLETIIETAQECIEYYTHRYPDLREDRAVEAQATGEAR